jgi:hypothetical protein
LESVIGSVIVFDAMFFSRIILGLDLPEGTRTMQANEIVDKMAEKYSRCKSYHDAGHCDSYVTVDFKTYFMRPRDFRFDWEAKSSGGVDHFDVIWSFKENACHRVQHLNVANARDWRASTTFAVCKTISPAG